MKVSKIYVVKNFARQIAKNRKGTSIVLFAAALTVFAACAALTIDIGSIVLEKSRLSAAVDSAALAGLQELLTGSGNTNIVVGNYLEKNTSPIESFDVKIGDDNKSVQVTAVKKSDSFFASLLGKTIGNLTDTAVAKAETITSMTGTRPLGVVQQTFTYGTQYILKEGASDGTSGNYGALVLGSTGGMNYESNLLYGYPGVVTAGDEILTETGNMVQKTVSSINTLINGCTHTPPCTFDSYNSTCTRIISIPVVETLTLNGRKGTYVVGFATFFLEGVCDSGGHAEVIGRFITYCAKGETSSATNDYGTYGIRLVK